MNIKKWDHINYIGLAPFRQGTGNPNMPESRRDEAPAEEQVVYCMSWLALHTRVANTVQKGRSSYSYKHDVEEWLTSQGRRAYISNGAFIEAARRMGYAMQRVEDDSPNAYFAFRLPRPKNKIGQMFALSRVRKEVDPDVVLWALADEAYKKEVTVEAGLALLNMDAKT